MIKSTLKSIAIALSLLCVVIVILAFIDSNDNIEVARDQTNLRVCVVDLNGNAVQNAKVNVCGNSFFTDNMGLSPIITPTVLENRYNSNVTSWFTVDVVVSKENFVPAVVLGCVVYSNQTRKLIVKIYPTDDSNLPYVCYVESPPSDYVIQLVER